MTSTKDQQKHASLCSVFLYGLTFFLKIIASSSIKDATREGPTCLSQFRGLLEKTHQRWWEQPLVWGNTDTIYIWELHDMYHETLSHMTIDLEFGYWIQSVFGQSCLNETLKPRFTPQCRMGYGFCCPNTTWRSCVGSHVWHRNALDRSTTLRTCHWSPGMCLRGLGWLYVPTIGGSTIQPKIDWIRHDYNWLHIVHRITYSHSIIF